jgi:peptide/nickel transport system substrate-binding protein
MARWFRLAGLMAGSSILLGACLRSDQDPISQDDAGQEPNSALAQEVFAAPAAIDPAILEGRIFKEAPMLAERVEKGELPPVADRLPVNPLVIRPLKQIGVYGGTLRRALLGDIVEVPGVSKTLSDNLMGYERPLPTGVQLNLAEGYEYCDEGRTAIFRIRQGVRWSDGAPFTVDDILFWYYDVMHNGDARDVAIPDSAWMVDGKPIQMEKIDDHTLRIFSHKPLGRILYNFCTDSSMWPKHFFAPLHPTYERTATYADFRTASTNAQRYMKPGMPQLGAWMPVQWVRGQRIVYERNPYYWKVDTAGNQLPYIDRIVFNIIPDLQVILIKFINGELDVFGRYAFLDMYPTLKAEEAKGSFRLGLSGPGSGPAFYLNWDARKPGLREAFRDKRVRMAMSHAINREEINQIVYHGLMVPSGYAFGKANPYFSEEAFKKYSAYDPELARRLLDEAGYVRPESDAYRRLKDGATFEVTIDVSGTFAKDVSELVRAHWEAVGIKVNLNIALRDIIWPRRVSGEFEIHHWGFEGPQEPLNRLNDWAIMSDTVPFWHRNAYREGPEWLWEATRAIQNVRTTVDPVRVRELMEQARDLHAENVPAIVVGATYHVWGATDRLGNVPDEMFLDDVFRGMRAFYQEQVFIHPDRRR